jgi:hypothetical protein
MRCKSARGGISSGWWRKRSGTNSRLKLEVSRQMASFAGDNDDWLTDTPKAATGGGGKGNKKGAKGKKGKGREAEVEAAVEAEVNEEELIAQQEAELPDAGVVERMQNVLDMHSKTDHEFWSTQPVSALGDVFEGKIGESGPIDTVTDLSMVPKDSHAMPEGFIPAGFEWCSVDVTQKAEIDDLYRCVFCCYPPPTSSRLLPLASSCLFLYFYACFSQPLLCTLAASPSRTRTYLLTHSLSLTYHKQTTYTETPHTTYHVSDFLTRTTWRTTTVPSALTTPFPSSSGRSLYPTM